MCNMKAFIQYIANQRYPVCVLLIQSSPRFTNQLQSAFLILVDLVPFLDQNHRVHLPYFEWF